MKINYLYNVATTINNKEAAEYLTRIGYSEVSSHYNPLHKYLFTTKDGFYQTTDNEKVLDDMNCIICDDKFEAFKGIAALSKDTAFNQWFIVTTEVYVNLNEGDWFISTDRDGDYHIGTKIDPCYVKKANIFDIISRFANKTYPYKSETINGHTELHLVIGELFYINYGIHHGIYKLIDKKEDGEYVFVNINTNKQFGFYCELEPFLATSIILKY